jgi:hypothetical protein
MNWVERCATMRYGAELCGEIAGKIVELGSEGVVGEGWRES